MPSPPPPPPTLTAAAAAAAAVTAAAVRPTTLATPTMLRPTTHRGMANARRKGGEGQGGVGGEEEEVSLLCLFPWRNRQGGAWNKTLLITQTRVCIE
jgi:hypothetical protein